MTENYNSRNREIQRNRNIFTGVVGGLAIIGTSFVIGEAIGAQINQNQNYKDTTTLNAQREANFIEANYQDTTSQDNKR